MSLRCPEDPHPDHDTIASFRQEHLASLSQLFVQVLRLCQQAGLMEVEKKFRRVKGYRELRELVRKLNPQLLSQEQVA